jgi:hypothetical protein
MNNAQRAKNKRSGVLTSSLSFEIPSEAGMKRGRSMIRFCTTPRNRVAKIDDE